MGLLDAVKNAETVCYFYMRLESHLKQHIANHQECNLKLVATNISQHVQQTMKVSNAPRAERII